VKGGIVLEQLARVDTVVMDKTGTLTRGEPRVTDVVPLNGLDDTGLLRVVAALESRSEHPFARAILRAAAEHGIEPPEPESFTPLPGRGVVGTLAGGVWTVGTRRLLAERGVVLDAEHETRAGALETAGKTAVFAAEGGSVAGLVAVADVALMREDWRLVPEAIRVGRRAARAIRQNLGFTVVYNVGGIALAAVGLLPPVWAAAAQSLPDVAIMLNSSRLLRGPGGRR
jgi:cation transport ATPase